MTPAPTRVVLAGGGSAGHTSPLIATASELTRLAPEIQLTAVGTARGLETAVVPAAGLPLKLIPPVPLPRRLGADLARLPVRLLTAVRAAGRILADAEAQVVLGFGGYVSTPVYLAARRRRVPIVLHEQNALPGLANRMAAPFAEAVFTSFPETPLPRATCIGLPLRRAITDLDRAARRPAARQAFALHPERPTLLVSGGSQGARSLNSAVAGARETLLAAGIQILHVLGPKNAAEVETSTNPSTGARYRPVAYVERMEDAYAAADLMLGRCGASTVLETAVVGLPAIFVPYPHGNGEQRRNARGVVATGGALLVEDAACTADWVRTSVPPLITDAGRLAGMSAALRAVAPGDAATRLAAKTLEVARS